MTTKTCSYCKQNLDVSSFAKDASTKSGYKSRCRSCRSEYEKSRIKKVGIKKIKIIPTDTKVCCDCNRELHLCEFPPRKDSVDGRRSYCRPCKNKRDRDYRKKTDYGKKQYAQNKEQNKINCAKHYQKNKESIKTRTKQYYEDNKEEVLRKQLIRQKQRLKSDLNYKISRNLRNRLWYALKNNTKYAPTLELLGCSVDELRNHLESKFVEGMTWDNYGSKWHIDHIRPLDSFDLTIEENQYIACNWQNLQPLWALDNIRKGISTVTLESDLSPEEFEEIFSKNYDDILA